MGTGRFKNGKFDLTVVANHVMTATDVTEWQRSLAKASELFWDASEGQVQFGRIFVSDDNVGIDSAEIVLHDSGDPSYGTWGEFGVPGKALHLMPYVKRQPLTTLHEMGHHVWALGEEYAGPAEFDLIDTSVTPPNNSTIPLVASTFPAGDLVGDDAILRLGTSLERRRITAHTATSLTVTPAFSQSPVNDSDGWVQYQFEAECSNVTNSRHCIMEKSRSAAGSFDAAGNWTPATNPVVEFCSDSNHDPDGDTQQEDRNGDSCWETIATRTGFTGLTVPDPAMAGPTTGFTVPDWIVLDKQPRFAVVYDRSGSMGSGNKMADAHHGATYWLEFCSLGDDLLTVIGYDHVVDTVVPLSQVSTLGSLSDEIADIEALGPRGSTNIRDGLYEARDQIVGPATRAAVQITLLLTDGIHNSPPGSSPLEVVPTFQEDGIRIYSLGVGAPGQVDMTALETISDDTGGRAYSVGDNQPGQIEAAMIEINAEVRGGIITTAPVLFPDSRSSALDRLLADYLDDERPVPARKRPALDEIMKVSRVKSVEQLASPKRSHPRLVALPVDVEQGTRRASFAVAHADTTDVWLYLVDPAGDVVDPGTVDHVVSPAPHEFAVVTTPMPGRWWVVAVRAEAGPATTVRIVAGGENPLLQVSGSARGTTKVGDAAMLTASARWLDELTGVVVTAVVRDPSGANHHVVLRDDVVGKGGSGDYRAAFATKHPGRHTGVITIRNIGGAMRAGADHLLLHGETDDVPLSVGADRFVRRIPFSFEVGRPREVRDPEDPDKWQVETRRREPRPDRPLKSASLRPRRRTKPRSVRR